jgi:hypothetical protein
MTRAGTSGRNKNGGFRAGNTRIRSKAAIAACWPSAEELLWNAAGFPLTGKFSTVREGLDGT